MLYDNTPLNLSVDLGLPAQPRQLPKRILFENIPNTNDKILRIDNSSLEQFTTCSRAAEYYLINGRETSAPRSALTFGGAIHKGLEVLLTKGISPESKQLAFNSMLGCFANDPVPVEEWRTPDRAIEVLEQYCKFYPSEMFSVVRTPEQKAMVELPFALPLGDVLLPDNSRVYILWTGRIDGIIQWDNQYWALDHKTSSMKGPTFWKDFELSQQMIGYTWAASQLLGQRITGVVINGLFCRKPSKAGTPTEFERQRFAYPDYMLQEWHQNTLTLVSDFLGHYSRSFFPKQTKWCCGKYGLCSYHSVCTASPTDRDFILQSSDFKDVTWSPLNNDTPTE